MEPARLTDGVTEMSCAIRGTHNLQTASKKTKLAPFNDYLPGLVLGERSVELNGGDGQKKSREGDGSCLGYLCIITVGARGLGDGVGFRRKNFDTIFYPHFLVRQ
jgi:hypothetical protein